MATTLSNRSLQLKSPLATDVLLPRRVEMAERLSQPFQCTIDFVSESGNVDAYEILGKDLSFSFELPSGGGIRHFNGVVTEFTQTGYVRRFHQYRAVLRPWLWLLTRTADCRIFQQKSIPDIFEEVVTQHGFNDYRLQLSGDYKPWDYCVQYRETDFNFVSRLLEQAGIHYFFEHADDGHVLVLCDDSTTLEATPGYEEVPFFPPDASLGQSQRDHINDWSLTRSVQTGAYATTAYDFAAPRKSLAGTADGANAQSHARADFEVFDFPAEIPVMDAEASREIAKVRIEEIQASHEIAHGRGDAAGLAAGHRFRLVEHPRADMNGEYVIVSATSVLEANVYDAGSEGAGVEYGVTVEAIDARTVFRPPRVTPKPVIQGAQTAVVVGKAGEEIDTDKYGRVKVQFPWDRYGKNDQNSSCWVRVAQVWAGTNWGGIQIPRIGQEVLVSFLEGDPDRPIITGRVYNADAMPPYDLPANATQSGVKSRSSKGGSTDNFNEIRFEDKKGEEEVYVHAEKDMRSVVEHDELREIGNDRTTTVARDEKRTVAGNRETDIGKNEKLAVGQDQATDVGKRYALTVGDEIVLQTGSSKLVMKKDGTIELSGVKLKIEGSQSITGKAGQKVDVNAMQVKVSGTTVDVKGTKTAVQGTLLDLKASAIASLKGSLTKIG